MRSDTRATQELPAIETMAEIHARDPEGVYTHRRAPAFDSIDELLDWSERHGTKSPTVYVGPDGNVRGSVEVTAVNNNPSPATPEESERQ